MNVIIFGGSGFIGSFLSKALADQNYNVTIITRKKWLDKKTIPNRSIIYRYWNIDEGVIDADIIQNADYIVNLVGENVARGRWTRKQKEEILKSRVKSSELIMNAIKNAPHPKLKCLVSASAIGWYGQDDTKVFTETDPYSKDFLGTTCKLWEHSIKPVEQLNVRLVILRMGIVLSSRGGFLAPIQRVLDWGIAPVLGNGSQIISWIHIQDYANMILYAFNNDKVNGVYNAVSPLYTSQKYMMTTLQKVYYKFTMKIRIPKWLIKFIFGEMSVEILKSCKVSSKKIEQTGFEFKYKNIEKAIANLLQKG